MNSEVSLAAKSRKIVFAIGLAWVILAFGQLTTSSLSLNSASGSNSGASVLWGEAQPTRSDEWLRSTPYWIGQWNDDHSADLLTPLEFRSQPTPLKTMTNWLMYPEAEIAKKFPTRVGFPLLWWAPVALSAISISLLLLRLTRSISVTGGLTAVTIFSPAVAWWSFSPLEILWPAASCLLLTDRAFRTWRSAAFAWSRSFKPLVLAVCAGIVASRLAFTYQPWAIITILVFTGIAFDFLIRPNGLKRFAPLLVAVTLTSVVMATIRLLLIREQYLVLASTVYPGQRRVSGGGATIPFFSGIFGGLNQTDQFSQSVTGTNLSEVARGWTILLVPFLLIVTFASVRSLIFRARRRRIVVATTVPLGTAVATILVLSWTFLEWPGALTVANPLTFVTADRAAQILGVLAPIILATALPVILNSFGLKVQMLASASAFLCVVLFATQAGNKLKGNFPPLNSSQILAISLLAALAISLTMVARTTKLGLLIAIMAGLSSIAWVNPINRGLGDLVLAPAVAEIREAVSTGGGRAATDNFFVDAVLAANGLPQLSGLQTWGPNEEQWLLLDSTREFEASWNRGTSYLRFEWASPGEAFSVRDQGDQIFVRIDPCDTRLDNFRLTTVISVSPREDDCLEKQLDFVWGGITNWVYLRK